MLFILSKIFLVNIIKISTTLSCFQEAHFFKLFLMLVTIIVGTVLENYLVEGYYFVDQSQFN